MLLCQQITSFNAVHEFYDNVHADDKTFEVVEVSTDLAS